MAQKPNVLFIITDQQRADHVGFMGHPSLRTPHLDALAAQGRVFRNAWVANPVCMPNRCSIMTGRLPTAHSVIFNDRSLPWNANTFVRQFRAAGYRTALLGKSHLQHGQSRNAVLPYAGEGPEGDPFPPSWNAVEDEERYWEDPIPAPEDFYGFEHLALSIDHGARMSGHHLRWALSQGADRPSLVHDYDADAPGAHRSPRWWQIYQPPYGEELHSTHFVAEETMAVIREGAERGEPWLAFCSFPDPHHPLTPPGDWFFRHRPEDVTLPASRFDDLAEAPAHLRHLASIHPKDQRTWVAPCGYGDDALLAEALAATYGMIEMIDDRVGQILACLEASGQAENTIVVFTSDHGDMMGDHGLFLKGFMHYRGTLQVPLVIRAPGVVPGATEALASSLDLAQTLLELCDLNAYEGMQGHSLVPLLEDGQQAVRTHVLVEDDVAPIVARRTPIPGKTRTLITERYRYTRNSKGEEQLFDLQADPDEMTDLARRDPTLRASLLEQLTDALLAADDAARNTPVRG